MTDLIKPKDNLILPKGMKDQMNDKYAKEQHELTERYNKRILDKELDVRYTQDSIELTNGNVLIQLMKEPYMKNGLVNVVTFAVPTPSGTKTEQRQDPLPYQNKGIVVNIDPKLAEHVGFKIGDMVQINEEITYTRVTGDGPKIKHMFYLSDDTDFSGHVLIPSREIVCILKTL